jgi:hypothetical protein
MLDVTGLDRLNKSVADLAEENGWTQKEQIKFLQLAILLSH